MFGTVLHINAVGLMAAQATRVRVVCSGMEQGLGVLHAKALGASLAGVGD